MNLVRWSGDNFCLQGINLLWLIGDLEAPSLISDLELAGQGTLVIGISLLGT
jgi:hypothetical protein